MAVLVKTVKGLSFASVKLVNGLAVASMKTLNGIDTTAGGGSTLALTAQTVGTPRSDFTTDGLGFRFTVGASPITVTEVGRWVISGNNQTHVLMLMTTLGASLGTVTVDTNGASPGQYIYGTLLTPIVLLAATDYYCFSAELNGGDAWYNDDTTVTSSAGITVVGARFIFGGNPENGADGQISYVPVNFKYT